MIDLKHDPLLLEIEEAVKQEKMEKFLLKYGKYLGVLAIILFATFGGYKIWESQHNEEVHKAAAIFYKNVQNIQAENAPKELEKAAKSKEFRAVSKIVEAKSLIAHNKLDKALKKYDEVAKDSSADKAFQQLAALGAANILINQDPLNPEIETRLKKLVSDDGVYRYSARELLAIYYIQNNKSDKAEPILEKLTKDADTPVTITQRAKQYLGTL